MLADLILGHTPIGAVEQDPYCCEVLRQRASEGWFPGLEVHERDIRTFDFSPYCGRVAQLSAGFPCVDISSAGKGAGIDGPQSGLWREVIRAVDAVRPGLVFLENSPVIRTRGRHVIIGEFVARGYAWRDGWLAASDVGAGHERKRWWCLFANADGLRELESERRIRAERGWDNDGPEQTPDTLRNGCQQGRAGGTLRERESQNRRCALDPADALRHRLQGAVQRGGLSAADAATIEAVARHTGTFGWNVPPIDRGICNLVDGMASRISAIKALGNGQVPLQAAAAWLILAGMIE